MLKTCSKIEKFSVGGFYGCMITGENFLAPFFHSRHCFSELSVGDIKVFEDTPDISHIYLKNTSCYGKHVLHRIFVLINIPDC